MRSDGEHIKTSSSMTESYTKPVYNQNRLQHQLIDTIDDLRPFKEIYPRIEPLVRRIQVTICCRCIHPVDAADVRNLCGGSAYDGREK
ncbi:MAG: hypothetical protein ACJ701_04025 [Nitrososphaera sp.]